MCYCEQSQFKRCIQLKVEASTEWSDEVSLFHEDTMTINTECFHLMVTHTDRMEWHSVSFYILCVITQTCVDGHVRLIVHQHNVDSHITFKLFCFLGDRCFHRSCKK